MLELQSTAVEATAHVDQGMIDHIDDLVGEINQFWVEVTGTGLPSEEINNLKSMHPDHLISKLRGLKMDEAKEYCDPLDLQSEY